jgi:hypothetical protein
MTALTPGLDICLTLGYDSSGAACQREPTGSGGAHGALRVVADPKPSAVGGQG